MLQRTVSDVDQQRCSDHAEGAATMPFSYYSVYIILFSCMYNVHRFVSVFLFW